MTNQNVQTNRHGPQNKGCNQASADSKHYLVSKLRPPCPWAWTKEISVEAYVRDLGSLLMATDTKYTCTKIFSRWPHDYHYHWPMKSNRASDEPTNSSQYEIHNLLPPYPTLFLNRTILGWLFINRKLLKNLGYIAVVHMTIADQYKVNPGK